MWPGITYEMGFYGVYQSLLNPGYWTIGELIPIAVPLGCWGVFTLWKLAWHFKKNENSPRKLKLLYFGLAAGFISCLQVFINVMNNQAEVVIWIKIIMILSIIMGLYFLFLVINSNNKIQPNIPEES